MTTHRTWIAPALGVSLAAFLILGARGAGGLPSAGASSSAPLALPAAFAGPMTLSARPVVTGDEVLTLTEILGARGAAVGDFGPQASPHAAGRLFLDTTDDGELLATPDQQRVKLTVAVNGSEVDPSNHYVRWEVRDPDDPASLAEIDASPLGGDNTGTEHELAPHWFVEADHPISNQIDRKPVDENTVIGEARTTITPVGPTFVSTVYFRFGDDAGDNYRIRAVLRRTTPAVNLAEDESGLLTVWRVREVGVYEMTKPNDDVQLHALGSSPGAFRVCITAGPNGLSDTMILGGDDAHRGEAVQAGANGVVETVANSGGPSFDPEATAALLRGTYAEAAPDQLAYLDWIVADELPYGPYRANLKANEIGAYMHAQTGFVHDASRTSLLGANAIEALAGAAVDPPHCGVAVGTLRKLAPAQLHKTDVHELGHLLIGGFENAASFHNVHSISQACGFRQGLHPAVVCSRHANMLRDRLSRGFGTNHLYIEVANDSAPTR